MSKPQLVEAVVFFDAPGSICKQMYYTEFEALLDGLAKIPEFADQQMRLVYVLINTRLQVLSAACFYMDFDDSGVPDSGWNLPLKQIAERGGRGPDLGGGPIRLACQSQCPEAWLQMHLWEPCQAAVGNDLFLLRDTLQGNALGVLAEPDVAVSVASEPALLPSAMPGVDLNNHGESLQQLNERLTHEFRQKTALLVRQQRERITALADQHLAEVARLEALDAERARKQQAQVQALQLALRQQEASNQVLQAQLAEQAQVLLAEQQNQAGRLRAAERQAHSERERQQEQFAETLQASLAAAKATFAEQIVVQEGELMQRGAWQLLERLAGHGMVFVVFHPGAGHLSLSRQDLERYLLNPLAYAANKCAVTEGHYRQWLAHYQQPCCEGLDVQGVRCSKPLQRIDAPARFVAGDSDCCGQHKVMQGAVVLS